MSIMRKKPDYEVGFRKPPESTRFERAGMGTRKDGRRAARTRHLMSRCSAR
jgi:hypothetical protein